MGWFNNVTPARTYGMAVHSARKHYGEIKCILSVLHILASYEIYENLDHSKISHYTVKLGEGLLKPYK